MKASGILEVTDEIEDWLEQRGVWGMVSSELEGSGYISGEIQQQLRARLALDSDSKRLLNKLLSNENGIPLSQFRITPEQWHEVLETGDCACAKLVQQGLARVQDRALLKPLKPAFFPEVQYLIGLTASI